MPPTRESQRAQLSEARERVEAIQRTVNERTGGGDQETGPGPVTGTSDTARADRDSLDRDIRDTASRDTARMRRLAEEERELIEARRERLDQQRQEEVSGIRRDFQETRQLTQEEQEREFASRSTGLITQSGGHLGLTQSHEGVLQNLRQTHRREISSLEAKKASAIREAQNAFNQRDFELARQSLQIARQTENDIFERENTLFNREIAVSQEQRQEETFEMNKESTLIERIAPAIAEQVSGISDVEERDRIITEEAERNGVSVEGLTGQVSAQIRSQRLEELGIEEKELSIKTSREKSAEDEADEANTIELTPSARRQLQGAGLTPDDISAVEQGVSEFGIKSTLKALNSPEQRRVVADIYDAHVILDEVETEIEEEQAGSDSDDGGVREFVNETASAVAGKVKGWWNQWTD